MNQGRKPLGTLLALILFALLVVEGLVTQFYAFAVSEMKIQLALAARSQARIIDLSMEFDRLLSQAGHNHRPDGTPLDHYGDVLRVIPDFGESGHFIYGTLVDGEPVFQEGASAEGKIHPSSNSDYRSMAEPMKRALEGNSGIWSGIDHAGVLILAAYHPTLSRTMGVMASLDYSEIRRPYVWIGIAAGVLTLLSVLLGAAPFFRLIQSLSVRLRQSEGLTESIVKSAAEGILSFDGIGIIQTINPAAEALFGYGELEISGRRIGDLLLLKKAELEKFLSSGGETLEVKGVRKDGSLLHLEMSVTLTHPDEKLVFTAIVRDVTRRKKAEMEVRENQRTLQLIFDTVPQTLVMKDREGRYQMVNRAWCQFHGLQSGQVIGKTPIELPNRPQGESRMAHQLDQPILSGEKDHLSQEYSRTNIKGIERKVLSIRVPLKNETGEIAGLVVLGMDITDRARVEQELRAGEERFRNLIDGSHLGIAIHQANRPLLVNQAFAKVFGYGNPRELLLMNNLELLVDPADLPRLKEKYAHLKKDVSGDHSRYQFRGIHKGGQTLQLETYFQSIEWRGAPAVQTTVMDITDRMMLENQLRQSQKMEAVGQLAGGIAHDFNNIIQIVRGYAELAQGKNGADNPSSAYLGKVLKAADGASALVRQLMAVSRQEVMQLRPLHPGELIGNLTQMVRRLIGENIELIVSQEDNLPQISGDPTMIEQVLLNLIVNARDAMPGGGRLELSADAYAVSDDFRRRFGDAKGDTFVRIRLSDTGEGMSQSTLEHLFEPFFTTKESGKGTGLGLSMAYGIIQQHHGSIDVSSEEGKGSTFTIYLPAETDPMPAPAPSRKEAPVGGGETILVAEDDPDVLDLAVNLLESQGYQVLVATDGEEALNVFREKEDRIDLALLDMVMPKMGGREVYQALAEEKPELPILFCTGYTADSIDTEFIRNNRFNLIKKPYSPGDLFKAVRSTLDLNFSEQSWGEKRG